MAKLITKPIRDQRRLVMAARNRGLLAPHNVPVQAWIQRATTAGKESFKACAIWGRSPRRAIQFLLGEACAYGKNPRQALGRALMLAGKRVRDSRRGAFAGLSGDSSQRKRKRRSAKAKR